MGIEAFHEMAAVSKISLFLNELDPLQKRYVCVDCGLVHAVCSLSGWYRAIPSDDSFSEGKEKWKRISTARKCRNIRT